MTTSVWLFKPRSHGRKKDRGPRAQRGPVAGATTKFSLAPSIGVSALCPCGHAAFFRRRASSFVRGVWCLGFGGPVRAGY